MSLDEMQARCDAATHAPWVVRGPQKCKDHTHDCEECGAELPIEYEYIEIDAPTGPKSADMVLEISSRYFCTDGLEPQDAANAAFIAHARTDMPRLIAALRVAMEGLEPFEDDCGGSTIEDDWRRLDSLRTHAIAALARVTAILEGK